MAVLLAGMGAKHAVSGRAYGMRGRRPTLHADPAARSAHGSRARSGEPCAPYAPPITTAMTRDAPPATPRTLAYSDQPCRRSLRTD
jgi:hypothetical protein